MEFLLHTYFTHAFYKYKCIREISMKHEYEWLHCFILISCMPRYAWNKYEAGNVFIFMLHTSRPDGLPRNDPGRGRASPLPKSLARDSLWTPYRPPQSASQFHALPLPPPRTRGLAAAPAVGWPTDPIPTPPDCPLGAVLME